MLYAKGIIGDMLEFIIFTIRYIPFWGVPMVLICLPFAYIFWLKDVRVLSAFFFILSCVSLAFIIFWVWSGGPDKSVQFFFEAVRTF